MPKLPIVGCQWDVLKRYRQDSLSTNGNCQAVQGLLITCGYMSSVGLYCKQSWLKRGQHRTKRSSRRLEVHPPHLRIYELSHWTHPYTRCTITGLAKWAGIWSLVYLGKALPWLESVPESAEGRSGRERKRKARRWCWSEEVRQDIEVRSVVCRTPTLSIL